MIQLVEAVMMDFEIRLEAMIQNECFSDGPLNGKETGTKPEVS